MIVIMRDAIMPDCCNTCVCSEGYGCGITGTEMTTKEMEERPDWCPLEEVEPCEDAVSRKDCLNALSNMMGIHCWRDDWAVSRANVECMLKAMPSAQPEDCDTCKHGYFGDSQCDNCRVGYPSHYERRTDEHSD